MCIARPSQAENLTTEGMRRAHGIYATDRTELDPAEPHRRSSLLAAAAKAALQKAIDNRRGWGPGRGIHTEFCPIFLLG